MDHKPGRVRRAAGFRHIDNVPPIDLDDTRLADELQSEIYWNRREGPSSGLDLGLNEGNRNRQLLCFKEHVSV